MVYVLMFFLSVSEAKVNPKNEQVDACEAPPSRFKSKNLKDLDLMTKFMRMQEIYPWFQYHCNGVICTAEEYEKMCYLIKQAKKRKEDPNLINVGMLK